MAQKKLEEYHWPFTNDDAKIVVMQIATHNREIRHPHKGDRVRLEGDETEIFVVFHVSEAAEVVTLKSETGSRFLQVISWSELRYCDGEVKHIA
ncbi:MAG TPA: hypothetical protein VMH04_24355 [Candidatus Solibacter sp.]|nr:hypothetical protein [Candidatus Solibacter sp.]